MQNSPGKRNADKYYFNKETRNIYRKQFNFKDSDIVIGNIGRLSKVKNQELQINKFNIKKYD